MTSVPIDCSNLWGEGDEGGSDSDIPAIDDTPTTPTTFPVLPCHCSNLSELSKFVTQLGTPFHNTYRLQKPVLLTDFVTHWNIFNTNGDIDMIDTLRERMALHSRTTVHCLYANDNTHFFGNGLCTSHELTLQDVLRASVMRASPDRPFYCRMRPIPTEVWPLFNLEFQSLLPASQHETSGMLFKIAFVCLLDWVPRDGNAFAFRYLSRVAGCGPRNQEGNIVSSRRYHVFVP